MLTAIRKSLEFIGARKGYVFEMQDIPPEDPVTYDMICKADTVGVFQLESEGMRRTLSAVRNMESKHTSLSAKAQMLKDAPLNFLLRPASLHDALRSCLIS